MIDTQDDEVIKTIDIGDKILTLTKTSLILESDIREDFANDKKVTKIEKECHQIPISEVGRIIVKQDIEKQITAIPTIFLVLGIILCITGGILASNNKQFLILIPIGIFFIITALLLFMFFHKKKTNTLTQIKVFSKLSPDTEIVSEVINHSNFVGLKTVELYNELKTLHYEIINLIK